MSGIAYHWRVLIVVLLGSSFVYINTTLVNVALPAIIDDFNTSLDRAQLVASMYLLALALSIPLVGYLSDRLGTKRLFTLAVGGFTTSSVLCGLAWDINSLIFFRILQGFCGGIIFPLTIAMVFSAAPLRIRALFISPLGLPEAAGPILSGYLVETSSWRLIFLITLPVGLLAMAAAIWLLRETERIKTLPFDYKGFILAGIGFCTALFALTLVIQHGWTATPVVVLFMVSGISLAAWVAVELTEKAPLLDLRIFLNPIYTQAALVYFVSGVILNTALFLMPLFLQNVRQLNPLQTGLLMMPEGITFGLFIPVGGYLYHKIGARPLIIPGFLAIAYSMFWLSSLDVSTSDAALAKFLALRGAGLGLVMLPSMAMALSVFSPRELPRVTAVTTSLRNIVPAFSIAFMAFMLQIRSAFHFSTLAQTVSPDSLASVQVLSGLKDAAGQLGASDAATNQIAIQIFDGIVQQRALVNAFHDVFLIGTVLVLLGLLPAIFLRKLKPEEEVQPAPTAAAAETAD